MQFVDPELIIQVLGFCPSEVIATALDAVESTRVAHETAVANFGLMVSEFQATCPHDRVLGFQVTEAITLESSTTLSPGDYKLCRDCHLIENDPHRVLAAAPFAILDPAEVVVLVWEPITFFAHTADNASNAVTRAERRLSVVKTSDELPA